MYFQKFPQTVYTLDNRSSVQIVTNITLRMKITEELTNNFSSYDLYDIKDGETPESLAYQFYGDPNLHWVILHANEILDPRFDWVLGTNELYQYALNKYDRVNGIHHFEDSDGNTVNGNVSLSVSTITGFSVGSALTSNVDTNIGYVTSIPDTSSMVVRATKGSFQTGDQLILASNTSFRSNIISSTVVSGTPITNLAFEEEENEARRRIRIIKPQYIERIIKEFESKLLQVNG